MRPLIGFDVVDLTRDAESRVAEQVPIAGRRHFLLLFDLSFSTADSLARAIDASRALLTDGVDPSDRVSVGVHGTSIGVQRLLNFTPDHEQVLRTLDALQHLLDRDLQPVEPGADRRDPLGLTAPDARRIAAQLGRAAGAPDSAVAEYLADNSPTGDGKAGAIMAEILYDMAAEESTALRQARRAEIERMASSFVQLAEQTASIEGSKHLVLFSGGFDPYLFEAGGDRTLRELQHSIEAFRQAGWSVHSVDVGRPGMEGRFDGTEGLSLLARETGGELYRNFNHLGAALERLLERTSVTYVLAFQADEAMSERSFRRLQVRLKDGPRGAKLQHRAGYWTGPPAAAGSAALEVAQVLLGDEEREDIATAVLAVPFKSGAGKPRVSVVLQLSGEDLLVGQEGPTLAAEVYGYAFGPDGVIADYFGQSFSIDLEGRQTLLATHGFKVVGDLDLDSGRYLLRLLVRNPRSGRYTVKSVPIDVPAFERSSKGVGPVLPLLVRPLRP